MTKKLGFTLIELSIVLVIIGLLVGGILVGRDLIKVSEIRAQISQIEEFKTATNTFKVKYGYLPGDMPPSEAAQLGFFTFTGAYAGQGCAAGSAFGNNDGIINSRNESYAFWSHLGDSKLIKGVYGGVAGNLLAASAAICASFITGNPPASPTTDSDSAQFFPRAKIASSNVFIEVLGNNFNAPNMALRRYRNNGKANMFDIFRMIGSSSIGSPSQLYQMDNKIDDGLPSSGDVLYFLSAGGATPLDAPPCTTSGISPIKYDLSSASADSIVCSNFSFLF